LSAQASDSEKGTARIPRFISIKREGKASRKKKVGRGTFRQELAPNRKGEDQQRAESAREKGDVGKRE